MLWKATPLTALFFFKWKHSGYLCSDKLPASLACYLSRDACARCHLATAGIFKCPDEYIAPGPDCSNWTLSALLHAQHTLMGLLTVLCIHLTKRRKKKKRKRNPTVPCQRRWDAAWMQSLMQQIQPSVHKRHGGYNFWPTFTKFCCFSPKVESAQIEL